MLTDLNLIGIKTLSNYIIIRIYSVQKYENKIPHVNRRLLYMIIIIAICGELVAITSAGP